MNPCPLENTDYTAYCKEIFADVEKRSATECKYYAECLQLREVLDSYTNENHTRPYLD